MAAIEFEISCVPPKTTSQTKRAQVVNGRPRFFPSKEHSADCRMLETLLAPHQPNSPVLGPVELLIELTWPWRASDLATKAKREFAEHVGRIWNSSKPDADNVAKAFIDILSAMRFIEDDARVVDLRVRKFFGSSPGIRVSIDQAVEDAAFNNWSYAL